ncbi:hypothetical protein [Lishizhenia sp.]|uniref:hypothetical protein n=1 Tax=Lishizhenia sp. TaxID=2497594 RepID=UPI00299EC8FB|nr:hypothetical protein [Lishizhenia sp.]MDX1447115.1 hypothetical protein [Lishizhenia sp.]
MKKRLKKHIQAKDFVKIYLADQDGFELYRFDGIIRDQNDDYILMVDFTDLTYDGVVVFRKADVSEIKHSKNEIFFNTVLAQEGFKDKALKKANKLGLHLNDFKGMIEQVKTQKLPLILERLYEKETKFQIGSVNKIGKKKGPY